MVVNRGKKVQRHRDFLRVQASRPVLCERGQTNFLKMKALKFKKVFLVGVFASLFFLPYQAEAKMFGQECSSVTTDNGVCSVTMTTCKQRFFWINVGSITDMTDMFCRYD